MGYISAEDAASILKELKSDGDTVKKTRILVCEMKKILPDNKTGIRKCLAKIGCGLFDDLIMLKETGYTLKGETIEYILDVKRNKEEIIKNGDCISLNTLALKGSDIIGFGVTEGPEVGRILNIMFDKVLENPELNNRKELEKLL